MRPYLVLKLGKPRSPVQRIVGNVHLAVFPGERAVRIQNHGRIVIDARRAPLEERAYDHHIQAARQFSERFGRWAGDRLRQLEKIGIFLAAKILPAKKLLQADDLRPARRRVANIRFRLDEVIPWIRRTAHLDQANREFFGHDRIIAFSGRLHRQASNCNAVYLVAFARPKTTRALVLLRWKALSTWEIFAC